ncbi:uncharacterized protein LOC134441104 [Engraulis encrasicolus]|uniref:uncharacterized protein LOC134441104 n=1 Tax=Engraulis encrasicolus TaxID=184585 RepID=UPI002FD17F2D
MSVDRDNGGTDYITPLGKISFEDFTSLPRYPRPVEFHVSRIAHVTTEQGMDGILGSGGFKGGRRDSALQWWGLVNGREEIAGAEQRYLDREFPNRTEEEKRRQKKILRKFTKSPAFRDGSRYGNFRFTLKLEEVLQAYSTQFCGGKDPTLRVWETIVYKQEIMYSVLVHSPDVHDYDSYPKLGDNEEGVCVYRNGEMIWFAQAISEKHTLRLTGDIYGKVVSTEKVRIGVFYVWDHVTLAFHIPKGKTLSFPPENLKKALKACGKGDTDLNPQVDEKNAKAVVRAMKRKQT